MLEWLKNNITAVWLGIICIMAGFVYYIKLIDAEENKEKPNGYIWRKAIIGGIGNIIVVLGAYHLITATMNWDENLVLICCAGLGYIGADTIFKMIEKSLEKYFLGKADKLNE